MSDYNCRLMHEADLENVIYIVKNSGAFAWSPQNIQDSFHSTNDNSFVLCTTSGNGIIGYAVIHNVLDECHLLNLVIKKQEQGRGLGDYLLRQLIEFVKHQNKNSFLLEVRASNALAIKLYEKLGFQRNGVRTAYYKAGKGREDAWLYSLSLT